MRASRGARPAGFTLIELLIAVVLTAFIMAAVLGITVRQGHFYTRTADVASAGDAMELAEIAIEPDLLPLNPAAGDVVHAGDDSLAIRTWRGVFAVCGLAATGSGHRLTLRRLTSAGEPASGDSARVYSEGTDLDLDDDAWLSVRIESTELGMCADGTPAWVADVTGLTSAQAATISSGAPFRVFRHGSYWFERTGDGWFLLTDARGGSKSVLNSPLAPEATETLAVRFRYLDAGGAEVATLADVVRIDMEVTAIGSVQRWDGERYTNARSLPIKLRNR